MAECLLPTQSGHERPSRLCGIESSDDGSHEAQRWARSDFAGLLIAENKETPQNETIQGSGA
jgi:hypothetical protein